MKNCTCVSLIWQFSSLCWCSQDYDVCFFGLRHCGRRCCARFFIWIYNVCKTRINFSMRVFVFLFWGILKMDFSMGVFVSLVSALLKIDFWMKVFVFWCQAYWKLIFQWKCLFFGFRPIENCFFNESLCFLGLRHCGRRCCARFFKWIYNVFRTRINFSMRVFVFWSQAYWKWIFQWEYLFFWPKAYWKLIFQW